MLDGEREAAVPADKQRFGPFEFDPVSGELRNLEDDGRGSVQRLPPQPARLLALLVERQGALVSREEIRTEIWPGVAVDFDASLHFCISQVRAALGDTADRPRYIENLPRRGYRIVAGPPTVPVAEPGARRRLAGISVIVGAIGLLAFLLWIGFDRETPVSAGATAGALPRIGILPFDPPDADGNWGDPGPIAEHLLEQLMAQVGERAEIIGPTSTASYGSSATALRDLAGDYDLDYLVNGRFIHDENGYRMLAELIRVRDGAHVWVERYSDLNRHALIADAISKATINELDSPRGERP